MATLQELPRELLQLISTYVSDVKTLLCLYRLCHNMRGALARDKHLRERKFDFDDIIEAMSSPYGRINEGFGGDLGALWMQRSGMVDLIIYRMHEFDKVSVPRLLRIAREHPYTREGRFVEQCCRAVRNVHEYYLFVENYKSYYEAILPALNSLRNRNARGFADLLAFNFEPKKLQRRFPIVPLDLLPFGGRGMDLKCAACGMRIYGICTQTLCCLRCNFHPPCAMLLIEAVGMRRFFTNCLGGMVCSDSLGICRRMRGSPFNRALQEYCLELIVRPRWVEGG